jgi:hypothetical protein
MVTEFDTAREKKLNNGGGGGIFKLSGRSEICVRRPLVP